VVETMAVRYRITPMHVVGSYFALSAGAVIVATCVGLGLALLGALLTTSGVGDRGIDQGLALAPLAFVALVWFVTPLLWLWQWRPWLGEEVRFTVTDEGIRQDGLGAYLRGDWSTVRAVRIRGPFMLVMRHGAATLTVPTVSFPSREAVRAAVAAIQSHLVT
jgi:hypothetical protein